MADSVFAVLDSLNEAFVEFAKIHLDLNLSNDVHLNSLVSQYIEKNLGCHLLLK